MTCSFLTVVAQFLHLRLLKVGIPKPFEIAGSLSSATLLSPTTSWINSWSVPFSASAVHMSLSLEVCKQPQEPLSGLQCFLSDDQLSFKTELASNVVMKWEKSQQTLHYFLYWSIHSEQAWKKNRRVRQQTMESPKNAKQQCCNSCVGIAIPQHCVQTWLFQTQIASPRIMKYPGHTAPWSRDLS